MKEENRMSEETEMPKPKVETYLASLRTQFIILVKEFLLKWCDEQIHFVVKENAEKAKTLGKSGLHQMKTDYEKFVEHIPEELEKVFAKRKCWMPLKESDEFFQKKQESEFTVEQLAEQLSGSIRDIQGQLGTLLAKYKFVSSRDSEWGVDVDDRTGQLRFKDKFIFTEDMKAILVYYIDLYNRMGKQLMVDSEKKQKELEGEAEDSWDRA